MGFEGKNGQHLNNGIAHPDNHVGNGNGRIHVVSPSRLQRIHGYDERWGDANGHDLFTGSAARSERPLRDILIGSLGRTGDRIAIADVGAGSGADVVRFAREVANATVDAIEATPNGAKRLRARILAEENTFAAGSRVEVEQVDAFDHLANYSGRYSRIQEHSFAHLFGPDERPELYAATRSSLTTDGLALISFKTTGDSKDVGDIVGEDPLGYLRQDPEYPDIVRLFVADEGRMVRELTASGLRVIKTDHWPEEDYDEPNTTAWFRGALVTPD